MCADLIHYGHIRFIKKAKELGDNLVVGLHSDETMQSYKRKPVMTFKERKELLESVKYIDEIIDNAPTNPNGEYLKKLKIDFMAIPNNVDKQLINKLYKYPYENNMIKIINYTKEISTSIIIERVINEHNKEYFELPDLNNKQLMFDSGITWHLTVPSERINRFVAQYEIFKLIKDIPGDIIECGVFKGESIIRFSHFREILGTNDMAKIIGFDNFNNEYPDTKYQEDQDQREHWIRTAGKSSITAKQLSEVFEKKNFRNFKFISGDICKTVPKFIDKNKGLKISLLHIDCDFTEPTYTSLTYFWSLISKGGILLLDNYAGSGTSGCSYFGDTYGVDKFFKEINIEPSIKKFPYVSRPCYIIKN